MTLTLIDEDRTSTTPTWVIGTEVPGRRSGDVTTFVGTLAGEVVRTRSPIMLEAHTETDLRERFPLLISSFHAGLQSFLAAPLIYRDEVIGVLQLRSKERGVYSQQHLNLAERVANQIAGAVANAQLYAEQEKAEKAVQAEKDRYRDLVDTIPHGIEEIDVSGTILFANAAHHRLYGYAEGELIGASILDLVPTNSEQEQLRDYLRYLVDEQPPPGTYFGQKLTKSGEVIDVAVDWNYNRDSGQVIGFTSVISDISERKVAEAHIKGSLQEKEVLLKEINHRVKNNLQIISSLLNLQSRDIQDEQALRSFQVSQDRIKAMALVHEKLYQSEDLARIDFGEYIRSLATDLVSSYGFELRDIDLKIDVEDILLGVDTAIPCGVIVNELVANSLKHAFPAGRSGEIVISFREVDDQYTMTFKDDGVGLPEDLDISHPSSLGLTIVNALTGQLGGTIALGRNGGSEISITFPAN